MPLVILEVFHDVLLLSQLRIEELGVGLELVGEALVRRVQEFRLIRDSLQEGVIYFVLDVIRVVTRLLRLVVIEELLDLLLKLVLLLIEVLNDGVILLLLLVVNGF